MKISKNILLQCLNTTTTNLPSVHHPLQVLFVVDGIETNGWESQKRKKAQQLQYIVVQRTCITWDRTRWKRGKRMVGEGFGPVHARFEYNRRQPNTTETKHRS